MNLHSEAVFKNETQLNQLNNGYSVNLVNESNKVALPIHIQNLEKALNLNSFLKQVHSLIDDKRDEKISITISKQQTKDVKSSMYSFNKTGKNKNWLKSILIDNSDESDDEDIAQSVEELIKIQKYNKNDWLSLTSRQQNAKSINSSLSSNLLSLSDSVPLNSLFKNDKTCKNPIKKQNNRTTNSKKKLKSDDPVKLTEDTKVAEKDANKSYLTNYFEPTLNLNNNSKDFIKNDKLNDNYSINKKDYSDNEINNLIEATTLENKLLDDIKYESGLADDILQTEPNMNDFVNSFLTNMNDQIIYSNQLPDEIFETEEEISNSFQSYDLNKFTNVHDLNNENSTNINLTTNLITNLTDTNDKKIDETLIEKQSINETELKKKETNNKKTDKKQNKNVNLTNSTKSISLGKLVGNTDSSINFPIISSNVNLSNPTISSTINLAISSQINPTINLIPSSTKIDTKADSINKLTPLIKTIAKKKDKTSSKSFLEIEPEQLQNKRRKLWSTIVKKEVPKAYKSRQINRKEILSNCKKLAQCCQKERKNVGIGLPKLNKERSKTYWKSSKNNDNDLTKSFLPPKLNQIIKNETNQEVKLI